MDCPTPTWYGAWSTWRSTTELSHQLPHGPSRGVIIRPLLKRREVRTADRDLNSWLDLDDELEDEFDAEVNASSLAEPSAPGQPLTNVNSARVLILNVSYQPLHVCSVKRAVTLLMHEVAERVEDSDKVLRSPSSVFPVPSVIRLKRFVRGTFKQRVAFNRKNVFRRDDHRCQYCLKHANDLTLDHVMPRSRGGPTSWENVVACCKTCNAKKRDRTPEEANMLLKRKPYAPRFMFSSAYGVVPDIDPIWEKYLPRPTTGRL